MLTNAFCGGFNLIQIPDKFNIGCLYLKICFNYFAFGSCESDLNQCVFFDSSTCCLKKFGKFGMILGKSCPGVFLLHDIS